MAKFLLSEAFINKYKRKKPPFGFGGLGELVYIRTYSRIKEDGKNEMWWETILRVVEGTYNMQKQWIDDHDLGWNPWKAQKSAQEMYDRMFNMKFLPPGRGIWAMGSKLTEERKLYIALNNCGFVSTESLKDDVSKPFCFLMDASMLGVGVGFDTKGAGKIIVKGPNINRSTEMFIIPDSREGWVDSIKLLIESYLLGTGPVEYDYSDIRDAGEPIVGFGGVSSGHKPLKDMHKSIRLVLDNNVGEPISVTTIVDIMNLIGKCVVSGNVRRTATIVFGDANSDEYLNLKNYNINPERKSFGWTSNNSIFSDLGMDYSQAEERIIDNGEPGFAWLENMKGYGRMLNGKDFKDRRAVGGNPCVSADSVVDTNLGKLTIKEISKLIDSGEELKALTYNEETKELEFNRILRAWLSKHNAKTLTLEVEENGVIYTITCTPDHKIFTTNRGYVEAKDLLEDDDIKIIS